MCAVSKKAWKIEKGVTHHLHALHCEKRVLVRAWTTQDGLAVDDADLPRVREEHPDRIERDGEEVAEQHEGCLFDAANERCKNAVQVKTTISQETYAASKVTGSRTQLPPSSKYLKHPVRRTSRIGSRGEVSYAARVTP